MAGYFHRYAPALPYLREPAPYLMRGPHYHAVARRGKYGAGPFGRFDAREEAEAFASDAANRRDHGRMEAIECRKTLRLCRSEGGAR